jgi:dihydropteroate synthase
MKNLEWCRRTYVMGIINITPDSFSGDGLILPSESPRTGEDICAQAVAQASDFIASGADILDIGGESTRPGALPVTVEEEAARVEPVIRSIAVHYPNVTLSVDTYRASVAEAALQAGAHMVNDVWGLKADPALANVVARYGVPVVLMHNRSSWAHAEIQASLGGRYIGMPYENLLEDVKRELLESVEIAHVAGIRDENILLDPGIGFGKTVEQNLELVDRLDEIKALGYPVLLGVSRKSFIGYTLNLPPDQRLGGTAAAVAIGIARGADIVRVHDVAFMAQVTRMADAITRWQAQEVP